MTHAGRWPSGTVAELAVSAIKGMAMRAARIPGAVSLTWGLPSFPTPEPIRDAVARALAADPDVGKYTLPDGLPELRHAIARQRRGLDADGPDPDRNVLVTAGNMQGLSALLRAVVDPGDEVILTDPCFASHIQQVRLCGARPVYWTLDEARGWSLDLDALPGLVGPRTRAIVLVTPSNPTGKVFEREALLRVAEIAEAADLLVVIDDPYSYLVYDDPERYFDLGAEPSVAHRLAYLFTFSKMFAMSGWRLGYMVVPESLKREVLKAHDATIICAPRISQVAGLAALGLDRAHVDHFRAVLAARRVHIRERLDWLAHAFSYHPPEGAYYVFPRIVAPHADASEFCLRVLDAVGVALTPGSAFGPSGEHHVRMAFCVSDEAIDEAFDRLERLFPR